MLNLVRLLLPALIPSWRFFDVIAPSPRIEYVLLASRTDAVDAWREFRPRPQRVPLPAMLGRLLWNARWNESLFLVSCAERRVDQQTANNEEESFRRIAADLSGREDGAALQPWLRFRLAFLRREGDMVRREVLFLSEPRRREDIAIR